MRWYVVHCTILFCVHVAAFVGQDGERACQYARSQQVLIAVRVLSPLQLRITTDYLVSATLARACRLAADVLEFVEPHVVVGVTTAELDDIIHDYVLNIQHAVPAPLNYGGVTGGLFNRNELGTLHTTEYQHSDRVLLLN